MSTCYVYILSNTQRMLYIGFTVDLPRRLAQHREKFFPDSYTALRGIDQLVHVEPFASLRDARAREKQLKGWRRIRKIDLVIAANPGWLDLSEAFGLAAKE